MNRTRRQSAAALHWLVAAVAWSGASIAHGWQAADADRPAPDAAGAPADADDPFARTVEIEGLEVRTMIRATGYAWTITNRRGAPVREVSLPVRHTAGIVPPDGWSYVVEDDTLTMTADRAGISIGGSVTLVAQTPFDLARVTFGPMTVSRIGDETVVVNDIWVPGPKRASAWWLTAAGVLGIAAVHVAVVEVRSRRRSLRGG